jgi:hypothetical protein
MRRFSVGGMFHNEQLFYCSNGNSFFSILNGKSRVTVSSHSSDNSCATYVGDFLLEMNCCISFCQLMSTVFTDCPFYFAHLPLT